jgi:hypothetical protein
VKWEEAPPYSPAGKKSINGELPQAQMGWPAQPAGAVEEFVPSGRLRYDSEVIAKN